MKKKILVLEKDKHLLDLIQLILADAGYLVKSCLSENEIFEQLEKFEPDAVLLDVIKPTPIGTKLCKEIKEHPEYGKIPIIVLSTHMHIAETKKICADDVVEKPFDVDTLLTVVSKELAA